MVVKTRVKTTKYIKKAIVSNKMKNILVFLYQIYNILFK
jgi:hypothetical protein